MKIPLRRFFFRRSGKRRRRGNHCWRQRDQGRIESRFFGFFLGVEFGQDFVGECADFADEIFEKMQNFYTFT